MSSEILTKCLSKYFYLDPIEKDDENKFQDRQNLTIDLKNDIPEEYHNKLTGSEIFNFLFANTFDYRYRYKLLNSLIDHKNLWPFDVNGYNESYKSNYVLANVLEEPCNNTYHGELREDHLQLSIDLIKRFLNEYNLYVDFSTDVYNEGMSCDGINIFDLIDDYKDGRKNKNIISMYNDLKKYLKPYVVST